MVSQGHHRGRGSMRASTQTRAGSSLMDAEWSLPCIVGPTASGKSALAEELACRLNSAVVSVDAMQVYRGMDIGTAKTPAAERNCPLLMVDVAEIDQEYSVALFQREAREVIDGMREDGKMPVLCGGTGLYLDAVIDEMDFPSGSLSSDARKKYETYAQEHGNGALHELLKSRDPASAALIHPNNMRRVCRALEMLDEHKSYAEQHKGLKKHAPFYPAQIWAISWEREELYQRIDKRVDLMFSLGLVGEVQELAKRGLSRNTTAGQAIGYKEVLDYLAGACSLEEARATIKMRTRRYAKRQLSWLRRDGRARWISSDLSVSEAAELILLELRNKQGA